MSLICELRSEIYLRPSLTLILYAFTAGPFITWACNGTAGVARGFESGTYSAGGLANRIGVVDDCYCGACRLASLTPCVCFGFPGSIAYVVYDITTSGDAGSGDDCCRGRGYEKRKTKSKVLITQEKLLKNN